MNDITRRDALKAGGATVAAALLPNDVVQAAPTWNGPAPESGAQCCAGSSSSSRSSTVLSPTPRSSSSRPALKYALRPRAGTTFVPRQQSPRQRRRPGPDIIMGTNDDPFKIPRHFELLDMTDLAEYLGAKYGGWYPVTRKYGMLRERWIALPQEQPNQARSTTGSARHARRRLRGVPQGLYRWVPKIVPGAQESGQARRRVARPCHGGRHTVGPIGACGPTVAKWSTTTTTFVLDFPPETVAALEYAMQLYANFIDGVLSWLDPSNNKAFLLQNQIGGDDAATAFRSTRSPRTRLIPHCRRSPPNMNHANAPIGPVGRSHGVAAHAQHICVMATQSIQMQCRISALHHGRRTSRRRLAVNPQTAMSRLRCRRGTTIRCGRRIPKGAPFRDGLKYALDNGYSGSLGNASAAVIGDFRGRRHVRRGVHRKPDAKGGSAARRRACRNGTTSGLTSQYVRRIIPYTERAWDRHDVTNLPRSTHRSSGKPPAGRRRRVPLGPISSPISAPSKSPAYDTPSSRVFAALKSAVSKAFGEPGINRREEITSFITPP